MIRNVFPYRSIGCAAVAIAAWAMASTASANVIGECTVTGYAYMAEYNNTSTVDGPDHQKTYFKAQPVYEGYEDVWGYGYVKFDSLSSTTVDAAYVVVDLVATGAMSEEPASEEYPAVVDLFSPGNFDVTNLSGDENRSTRTALYNHILLADSLTGSLVMTHNGTYSIDITDLYNRWVTGETVNNGLIFESHSMNSFGPLGTGCKFAGFNYEEGGAAYNAPYISTTVVGTLVPEPVTMAVLAMGGLALLRRRRR